MGNEKSEHTHSSASDLQSNGIKQNNVKSRKRSRLFDRILFGSSIWTSISLSSLIINTKSHGREQTTFVNHCGQSMKILHEMTRIQHTYILKQGRKEKKMVLAYLKSNVVIVTAISIFDSNPNIYIT